MRKEPKRAPLPVLMILLPFVAAMTLWDLAGWLVAVIWDGVQRLGPRFQGFVLGMWAGMALVLFAATMAMFG